MTLVEVCVEQTHAMDGTSPNFPFAHSNPLSNNCGTWEPLYSFRTLAGTEQRCDGVHCEKCTRLERMHGHANKVAALTARFAAALLPLCSNDREILFQWGYRLGLWHDLGKFALRWQQYLKTKAGGDFEGDEVRGTVDHSTAGAQHAVKQGGILGHLMAMMIAGHHAGLPDATGEGAALEQRLAKTIDIPDLAPDEVLQEPFPEPPQLLKEIVRDGNATSFFCRMLFSCLVDADFLATEAFMAPDRRAERSEPKEVLQDMLHQVEQKVDSFGKAKDRVTQARRQVYEDCLNAAEQAPGCFSLTVPTGGGKTLSSLAFALKHAIAHGKQRVIYVIPFTSIIEQNAEVFNQLFKPLVEEFGSLIVLEHHSNLDPERETTQSRLASENWDAPLVVTTAVQFYESLYAARTSQCRKLHRIANAVVILDEAQCLPVDYLKMCLGALENLTSRYGTSVVLCTATPPAVEQREAFSIGLTGVREIVSDREALYRELKRVKVVLRGALADEQIADEMGACDQVLAIVNTRAHAQRIFQKLPEDVGNFHLSALMCPEHRREVLREVRRRLDEKKVVRLVSTQLIEAGVDVDFPRVYRSLAGIDSIGQAAGRCNRNGKLEGEGELHLFSSEEVRAERYFGATTSIASEVLALHGDDPLGLEAVNRYFELYYHRHRPESGDQWDTKQIADLFKTVANRQLPFLFKFQEAAKKFRFIENEQISVLIPFNAEAETLLTDLRNEFKPLNRDLLRRLQAYSVQIYEPEFRKNRVQFESVRDDGFHILICPETHYSPQFGLHFDEATTSSPLIL